MRTPVPPDNRGAMKGLFGRNEQSKQAGVAAIGLAFSADLPRVKRARLRHRLVTRSAPFRLDGLLLWEKDDQVHNF
jgi:hypothetical protein